MGGGREEGGGQGPGTSPWKITSCHLFLRRKTGTNFPRETIPPSPLCWSCLDPHTHVWRWNYIFYFHFLHVAGLAIILSRANCLRGCAGWSAPLLFACNKVSKVAKIRNRYNQVPHLTQDTNGKVTNSQKTPQTRAKRSALSQQVTTKHI